MNSNTGVKGTSERVKVVGLAGSLRRESATRLAVRNALQGAGENGARVELLDLGGYHLPFWGDDATEAARVGIERFRADLQSADGIILGSPENHGSVSGVLKNALDLTGFQEFEGKMLGLVGVAGGRMGAQQTLEDLRTIGRFLHAWVVPTQVSVANSAEAFGPEGEPRDPEIGVRLRVLGRQVAHFAWLHKCENYAEFVREFSSSPSDHAGGGEPRAPISAV
jgi:NAD(P)H-dependent FMN reductase